MTSEARRPFPGRQALVFIGLLLIATGVFGGLALLMPHVSPACGCTSAAPVWTPSVPLAVTLERAESLSGTFTGTRMTAEAGWQPMGDRVVAETVGRSAYALVDGESGKVLMAAMTGELPGGSAGTITEDAAANAARSYMDSAGVPTGTMTALTTRLESVPDVFEVGLYGADHELAYRVYVNGVSGKVFAFTHAALGQGSAPIVSKDEAVRRARGALTEEGDVVLAADLALNVGTSVTWTWQVSLAVPMANESDVYTGGGYVEVNAWSGSATVLKDARDNSQR